jgi:hypothetical protein
LEPTLWQGGEDFQPHVAALLGPFVVLLGQHRTDQPDDGLASSAAGSAFA